MFETAMPFPSSLIAHVGASLAGNDSSEASSAGSILPTIPPIPVVIVTLNPSRPAGYLSGLCLRWLEPAALTDCSLPSNAKVHVSDDRNPQSGPPLPHGKTEFSSGLSPRGLHQNESIGRIGLAGHVACPPLRRFLLCRHRLRVRLRAARFIIFVIAARNG